MNAFWLSGFSAKHAKQEHQGITGEALPYIAVCILAALFTKIAGAPVMDFLYKGKYVEVAWQLPIYCTAIGIAGLTQVVGSSFKARGLLLRGNLPHVACGLVTLIVSLPLMQTFGQPGAIYANFVGNATGLLIAAVLLLCARIAVTPCSGSR